MEVSVSGQVRSGQVRLRKVLAFLTRKPVSTLNERSVDIQSLSPISVPILLR